MGHGRSPAQAPVHLRACPQTWDLPPWSLSRGFLVVSAGAALRTCKETVFADREMEAQTAQGRAQKRNSTFLTSCFEESMSEYKQST